jgi:hypothetical protein
MKITLLTLASAALLSLGLITISEPTTATVPTFPLKQSNEDCNNSLTHLRRQIASDGRQISTELKATEISGYWEEGRPADRPYEVNVVMSGDYDDILAVLSSPQMLTSLSNGVIQNCNLVSVVTYALNRSDLLNSYGLINNTVQGFECPPNYGRGTRILWGFQHC